MVVRIVARLEHVRSVREGLRRAPVVSILGPRQAGKTTLARIVAPATRSQWFDLENPRHLARLDSPMTTLEGLRGLVVIDEIQRKPELFSILRVLVDRRPLPARFLVLGSASPALVRGVSESLAGRVSFVHIGGFHLGEVGARSFPRLWHRGGFPRSFLARSDRESFAWRDNLVATFLERDVPQLGITVPAVTLRRFWTMIAHFHGQIWSSAELARSLGSAEATARRYLDILTQAFMVRQLSPWFENVAKRQVKSPKVYVRDSGILHSLLDVETPLALQGHPKLGASWEGFALEQVLQITGDRQAYFWATHGGAELDLLVTAGGQRWGFEFKHTDAPITTKSMHVALEDLNLARLFVVYPGPDSYPLAKKVHALSIQRLAEEVSALRRIGGRRA